jgi:hypothetical protein
MAVRRLLARKPETVQLRGAGAHDDLRRHPADAPAHAPVETARRDDGHLLLDHDVHERRESGASRPHRRQAVLPRERRKVAVAARECTHRGGERFMRQGAGRRERLRHGEGASGLSAASAAR